MERRLAAIVATDIVGYSRLMGEDEPGTLSAIFSLRRDVIDPAIAARGGAARESDGRWLPP
jgi:adenylate cyclase